MTTVEFIANTLQRNFELLKTTLSDFSDSDLLARPVPGANHTAWQLGHLILSETGMLKKAGATMPELPAGFAERYGKDKATCDDAKAFGSKAELLELFAKVRAGTIAYAKTLSEADLDRVTPDEQMRSFVPTYGAILDIQAGHLMMHLGQMQVIRRKLGKKLLF